MDECKKKKKKQKRRADKQKPEPFQHKLQNVEHSDIKSFNVDVCMGIETESDRTKESQSMFSKCNLPSIRKVIHLPNMAAQTTLPQKQHAATRER